MQNDNIRKNIIAALLNVPSSEVENTELMPTILRKESKDDKYGILDEMCIRDREAGGVTFLELLEAIRTVAQANVVGADVNELAPMLDASGVSTATAVSYTHLLL